MVQHLIKETKREKIQHVWSQLYHSVTDVRFRLGFVLVLAVFIGLGLPYIVLKFGGIKSKESDQKCMLEHEMRINCLPGLSDEDQDKDSCEKAGCCWDNFGYSVPNCFYSYPNNYNYTVLNVTDNDPDTGFKLQITPAFNKTPLETEIMSVVEVSAEFWTSNHLRILLNGGNSFSPYENLRYRKTFKNVNDTYRRYVVSWSHNPVFHLSVSRSGKRYAIFNSVYGPLIVSRGLTEITTLLPSSDLYGIGQSPKNSFRHDLKFYRKYSLFSRMNSNATSEAFTLSAGVHPFYLVMEKNGLSHGVLLVSSLPVEIIASGYPSVTFRTGDTRLDFHIFMGPTPTEVVRQLTEFIGRPAMPPYWALGYHSCRDSGDLKSANKYINYTRDQRIPHESDCGTVRVMNSAFERNSDINLIDFTQALKSTHRKLTMFQSPHVALSGEDGLDGEQDDSVFLRNSDGSGIYKGYLENGERVSYPDFFNSAEASRWLRQKFRSLNDTFDGLFLTRNTPLNYNISNTMNCSCCLMDKQAQVLQIANSIAQDTVCMGAIHSDGRQHIYYHNMYGYANAMKVKNVLQDLWGRKVFLTSLSTFIGSGNHGGHWGGEVESTWVNLKQTITQTLDFSIFGMPLTGIPLCGSHGDFDQELCSKWIQVAAFQPLMFSYRIDSQEPLMQLTSVGRRVIQLRYSLLPYLYSLFHNASKLGDTVVRPLMFEFPKDRDTYGIDEQFMWGSGLMVSPIITPYVRNIKVYFPSGCWYDFYSGKNESESSKGGYKTFSSIKNHVNLYIRGGHVIPTQPSALSTAKSRNRGYIMTIALNCVSREDLRAEDIQNKMLAYGELFIDDGYSKLSPNNSLLVAVTVRGRNVTIESSQNNLGPDDVIAESDQTDFETSGAFQELPKFTTTLDDVRIYGMHEKPAKVLVDGVEKNEISYNPILETFSISKLNLDLHQKHTITWHPVNL